MPEQSPLHATRRDLERVRRYVDQMKAATSFDEYEDAWMGFLDAAYRIPNRIRNAGQQAIDANEKQPFKSWFGTFEARRDRDPFLRYSFHARNAETHSIQIATERQPGGVSFRSTGTTHIREIRGYADGHMEFIGSGSPLKVEFTPSKVVMSSVVVRDVKYEPPEHGPPHPHAETALSFFEEWIDAAEAKFFPD